jgi:septum site-determining protein MinC
MVLSATPSDLFVPPLDVMEVATRQLDQPVAKRLRLTPREPLVKVGGHAWQLSFTLDDEAEFVRVEEALRVYLQESQGWFAGGDVTVDVGRRIVFPEQVQALKHVLEEEFGLKVAGFRCDARVLEEAIAEQAGAPVSVTSKGAARRLKQKEPESEPRPLLFKGTCRSGTVIRHDGDVVIWGDVNPGAQVSATGDIIVLGALRGVVHAGSADVGPTEAMIVAFSLQPMQLRIGHQVSVSLTGEDARGRLRHPEVAYVSGGKIVADPLTGGGPKFPGHGARGPGRSTASGKYGKPSSKGGRGTKGQ